MADLSLPDIELLVYPTTAIPQKNYPGFIIGDVLGNLMGLGQGDSRGLGLENMNPTVSVDWLAGTSVEGGFTALSGLEFVRFLKDGKFREGASSDNLNALSPDKNSELCGFILEGREGLLDCKIGETILDTGYTDLNWEGVQGEWKTVLPPDAPARTRITNSGTGLTAKARTKGDIAGNRSLRFDVQFIGSLSYGVQPGFRLSIGNETYAVVGRHGQKWTVEKRYGGDWRVLRRLDGAPPCNMSGGRYVIRVRRIAGRLVISINGQTFHFLETREDASGRKTPCDAAWPAGKIGVNCYNVRATVGVALIKYATPADVPFTGSYARQLPCKTPLIPDEQNQFPEGKTSGWKRDYTNATAVIGSLGNGFVTYSCELTANAAGIDTPFVSKVLFNFAPQWKSAAPAAINLRPAISRITVDSAMPPIAPGAEMTVDVDRAILDKLMPGWDVGVHQYHPIQLRVRRRYNNGSTGDWVKLFKGYIYRITKRGGGVNVGTMTLTCRDSILRLQKPAAVIDHRYPPLDFVFAFQAEGARPRGEVWGSDCVKEILRRTLGDDVADSLNATGIGERFFNSHFPLIDFSGDTAGYFGVVAGVTGQPPTQNGFLFPPPFGEDALSWINKIAAFDHAIFYYGWPSGYDDDWPVPIYGRILNIISGRPTIIIPDNDYIAGDVHKLLQEVETETRPDRDINRILVWANPGGASAPDFIPAIRMAEARVGADDINAPEKTWERTEIIKEDLASPLGGAEGVAMGRIALQRNVEMLWPSCTIRGNATIQWGDKIQFKMSGATSDESIQLDGKTYRVEKVMHTIEIGDNDAFKTDLSVRPLSATGF